MSVSIVRHLPADLHNHSNDPYRRVQHGRRNTLFCVEVHVWVPETSNIAIMSNGLFAKRLLLLETSSEAAVSGIFVPSWY